MKINTLTIAMHIALSANKLDTEGGCIDAWNGHTNDGPVDILERGFDSFYFELAKCVPLIEREFKTLLKGTKGQDPSEFYDGLFELEVCQAFGEWFGNYISENIEAPSELESEDMIKELIEIFTKTPANTIHLNPEAFARQ